MCSIGCAGAGAAATPGPGGELAVVGGQAEALSVGFGHSAATFGGVDGLDQLPTTERQIQPARSPA
jgi:hypothetical protein